MINLEKIRALYKIGRNLQWKDIQVLLKNAQSGTYAPQDYLIKEGSCRKEVFFIRKGLVRAFYINDKGEEITLALRCEHETIASTDIILFDRPSRFYFQALEPTETYSMDYDLLQRLLSGNPKLEAHRKHILLRIIQQAQERVESFVLYSPEERYEQYVSRYPDMINRVPDKYIANILGVTPVSLSRIRKRIASRSGQ